MHSTFMTLRSTLVIGVARDASKWSSYYFPMKAPGHHNLMVCSHWPVLWASPWIWTAIFVCNFCVSRMMQLPLRNLLFCVRIQCTVWTPHTYSGCYFICPLFFSFQERSTLLLFSLVCFSVSFSVVCLFSFKLLSILLPYHVRYWWKFKKLILYKLLSRSYFLSCTVHVDSSLFLNVLCHYLVCNHVLHILFLSYIAFLYYFPSYVCW